MCISVYLTLPFCLMGGQQHRFNLPISKLLNCDGSKFWICMDYASSYSYNTWAIVLHKLLKTFLSLRLFDCNAFFNLLPYVQLVFTNDLLAGPVFLCTGLVALWKYEKRSRHGWFEIRRGECNWHVWFR